MSSIETNLETIRTAIYGKDMRQAIYEAIKTNHSDIANINETARAITATYIQYTLSGMFRGWKRTDRTMTGSTGNTLLAKRPYYLIEKKYFDPDNGDGLMIWKNTTELVPPAWYSFDTTTYESEGKVEISFHTSDNESYFTPDDRFYFAFYKKPASSGGGVIGESVSISSVVTNDVVGQGTNILEGD